MQSSNRSIIVDIMARAENSHKTMMNLIKPGTSKVVNDFGWKPPPNNVFKLNTDCGCRSLNAAADGGLLRNANGGLLRNANGDWVAGVCANIGISSVINAELWGLFYGLNMAWKLGVRKLLVEVDGKCIIQLIVPWLNHDMYGIVFPRFFSV